MTDTDADARVQVHLLVLVHGMWGNPGHLDEIHRIIKEVKGEKHVENEDDPEKCYLEVLVAQTNSEDSTYDGFDWGGERIAEEVSQFLKIILLNERIYPRYTG